MKTDDILKRNMSDLRMASSLAKDSENKSFSNYIDNRINNINENASLYKYVNINTIVDSYVVDLQLFIRISNLLHDIESKDFYKSRLIDVIKNFDYLKSRKDLSNLI